MATRNLTAKFMPLRASALQRRGGAVSLTIGDDASASAGAAAAAAGHSPAKPAQAEAQPQWVEIHDTIAKDIAASKENIRTLQKLHAIRLKVSFGEAVVAEQQQSVDALTSQITSTLRRAENQLKQIATVGNDGTLTSQERTTRLNVMRSLGQELAGVSKHFRQVQKEFFRTLRAQEKIGDEFFSSSDGQSSVSLEDAMNKGLTPEQVAELALIEQQANDREKEIIRIAQSVNELATLFKELNMLVIEQGTVLDRIDYNIETSLAKIKKGVVDLEAAEKTSRHALATKCIVVLAIIVFMLLIVFIWKNS